MESPFDIVFACASIYFLLLVQQVESIKLFCPQSSGMTPSIIPGTGCKEYYTCKSGAIEHHVCPKGTLFNFEQRACLVNGICFEIVCTGRLNGNYPDVTEQCQRYYSCENGRVESITSCEDGLYFNGTHCSPDATKCPPLQENARVVSSTPNHCIGKQDGYYFLQGRETDDCRSYMLCNSQQQVATFSCPGDQSFNGTTCVPKSMYQCRSFCSNQRNGLYADTKTGCKEYIFCHHGKVKHRKKCPPGKVFDGENCVPAELFQCSSNPCHEINNGFYNDYSTSCREYGYCKEGSIVNSTKCPLGTNWNGSECVSSEVFMCSGPILSADCLLKSGFHFDLSTQCNKYYFCKNGQKTIFQCSEGLVFNGSSCVRKTEFECPKPVGCVNQSNGYYLEPGSNCRSYYYCLNGQQISYICSNGGLFNGEKCVNPHFFNCPLTETNNDCKTALSGFEFRNTTQEIIFCQNGIAVAALPNIKTSNFTQISHSLKNPCNYISEGGLLARNCKQFHICKNFTKVHSMKCKFNHNFNGSHCVPTEQYECPFKISTTCHSNGFFPDFNSGCKNYYFCLNEEQTWLSCRDGNIFNGDICVKESSFNCDPKEYQLFQLPKRS